MYRIYKKQGNKILGSLDINERGLIQALTTAYPTDAQKAIIAKHKVEDGAPVTFKAKGFNWRIVKLRGTFDRSLNFWGTAGY